MAETINAVLSMSQKIDIRSATIGTYFDRNKRRITQAGAKFLELSETAKQRDDWKGRLELWKQDTLLIANESVDKLNAQLDKLGNDKFEVGESDTSKTMEIAHPFMMNIKNVIEQVDAVMCQIQLQWVSSQVDDFIYDQASNQSVNALNKIISRFVYLSDESAKRNKGLFNARTFERMLTKELREQINPQLQKETKAEKADVQPASKKPTKKASKEDAVA